MFQKKGGGLLDPPERKSTPGKPRDFGVQYSKNGILRYEQVFGVDYVSVGGETTTEKFCEEHLHDVLEHERNKVLDIGCGIGGSAFYMARNYGVDVYGIDLSQVGHWDF